MTPSLSVHQKRRSTKRSSLRSSSRSQTRCASSVKAARTTSKRWVCDVFLKQYTVRSSVVYVFLNFLYFKHVQILFSHSICLEICKAKLGEVKKAQELLVQHLWCRCQLWTLKLPELRSFVSLHDRCSSTAACCAVAPCFIDPVLGRKRWNMVKRWNMPR